VIMRQVRRIRKTVGYTPQDVPGIEVRMWKMK
jgi:hypothetical protein